MIIPKHFARKYIVLTLTLMTLFSGIVLCQSNSNRANEEDYKELLKKSEELSKKHDELTSGLALKDREVSDLKAKFEATNAILNTVFVFLAIVLSIGTLTSLVSWFRNEFGLGKINKIAIENASNADERARQGFALATTGEAAAQTRASEVHQNFLEGSRQTLTLVNETLTLAKEASERAAKFIERKARQTVNELDRECQALLANVPAHDDRGLIDNPARLSSLRSVAQKITGFEINRFILPEDIELTPHAYFIRGMDFHLRQQFDDAIENWKKVAFSESGEKALKSVAWYWIGYEQNNLRNFTEAEQSFQNALKDATDDRKYELERIQIETRFFNTDKKPYTAEKFIKPLKVLLEGFDKASQSDELTRRENKVTITLGNVISQRGYELLRKEEKVEATKKFVEACRYFEDIAEHDKWAAFGLAEMLYELGETARAEEIFRSKVRNEAIKEAVNREEPRTKVLARTTELICCLRVPEFRSEAPSIASLVLQDLGRVDARLTVYSQFQKRNVSKDQFQIDLAKLME